MATSVLSTTLSSVTDIFSSTAENFKEETLWILIVGFVIAFILAAGVGANDVANTFGTSVGAKVLTLRNACILATIFELLGAVTLVAKSLKMEATLATIASKVVETPTEDYVLCILLAGFFVSFILAFGIGANDVANSFGTSVGSKVLTLRTACILATIFEIGGSVLLGYKVSETIRKGIVDVDEYKNDTKDYMLGMLSALGGSAIWLIVATFLKMPISGTHSIVGSVLGFTLVAKGTAGIQWWTVGKIVMSWFISPIMSGMVSGGIFILIRYFILNKKNSLTPGLRSLPIFYGLTVFINIISITLDGPEQLKVKLDGHDWFEKFFGVMIALVLGLVVALLIYKFMVPRMRLKIEKTLAEGGTVSQTNSVAGSNPDDVVVFVIGNEKMTPDHSKEQSPVNMSMNDFHSTDLGIIENGYKTKEYNGFSPMVPAEPNHNTEDLKTSITYMDSTMPVDGLTPNSSAVPLIKSGSIVGHNNGAMLAGSGEGDSAKIAREKDTGDKPEVGQLFSALQILTASFGSFAHGGNDVSNAIGPLIALWLVYQEGVVQTKAATPIWLLVFGGVGISIGLWVWGRRVIKTMGEDLTKITPSSGFTIEIGAAVTVLVASKIGIPVSTTHCKVGSVVTVGQIRQRGGVDWKLFTNIFLAWIVTVPASLGLSALLMFILQQVA